MADEDLLLRQDNHLLKSSDLLAAKVSISNSCYMACVRYVGWASVTTWHQLRVLWNKFRSQWIAVVFPYDRSDRRRSQTIAGNRTWFYFRRRSHKRVSIWSQNLWFCDHMETRILRFYDRRTYDSIIWNSLIWKSGFNVGFENHSSSDFSWAIMIRQRG